jgi:GNAT superfamily N-acetyltransferase
MLSDASHLDLVEAIDLNVESAFWLLAQNAPGAELIESTEVRRYSTNIDHILGNAVLRSQFEGDTAPAKIREALDSYARRGLPMMWSVGPSSFPKDLGAMLEYEGCSKIMEIPGMAADLSSLSSELQLMEGVQLHEVLDEQSLDDWKSVVEEVFHVPEQVAALFTAISLNRGYGVAAPFRNYIAYFNGRPVATSSLFLSNGVAGIYCVATKKDLRGKGLGRAMTLAPLLEAKRLGFRYAILQASDLGLTVYEKLGFVEYTRFQRYAYVNHSKPS